MMFEDFDLFSYKFSSTGDDDGLLSSSDNSSYGAATPPSRFDEFFDDLCVPTRLAIIVFFFLFLNNFLLLFHSFFSFKFRIDSSDESYSDNSLDSAPPSFQYKKFSATQDFRDEQFPQETPASITIVCDLKTLSGASDSEKRIRTKRPITSAPVVTQRRKSSKLVKQSLIVSPDPADHILIGRICSPVKFLLLPIILIIFV